jgi:esterase/lipase superfamily enzyme
VRNEGLYAILRLILNTPKINNLRINLIGHSFGCKVACSAREELATKQVPLPNNISVNLVLLQAAFATDGFDQGKLYEKILPAFGEQIRVLVTKSDLDVALKSAFPLTQPIDFFHTGVPLLWVTPARVLLLLVNSRIR